VSGVPEPVRTLAELAWRCSRAALAWRIPTARGGPWATSVRRCPCRSVTPHPVAYSPGRRLSAGPKACSFPTKPARWWLGQSWCSSLLPRRPPPRIDLHRLGAGRRHRMRRCQGRAPAFGPQPECAAECGTLHRFTLYVLGKRAQFRLRRTGEGRKAGSLAARRVQWIGRSH
jgi:hypothetical protein